MGPAENPLIWFGIGAVITFFKKDSEEEPEIWFGPRVSWSLFYNTRVGLQLQWYTDELARNADQISALFQDEDRARTLNALLAWSDYRKQRALDALARGDYP